MACLDLRGGTTGDFPCRGDFYGGVKLKASSDDDPNWNGANDYGFSAMPNGIYSGGSIVLAGTYGYIWTAPSGPFTGFLRFSLFDAAELPDLNLGDEALGMSVRCALDEAP